jgi:uncharacterized membrane protein
MMMIGMVALWALLIWGAVYLATRVTKQDTSHPSSAIDVLEQRYARGEIDRDELDSRRSTLQQQ